MIKLPDSIEDFCIACVPVGSRVTCVPPPTDTDQDILCLVEDGLICDLYEWLESHNWELEGEYLGTASEFDSYRKTCGDTEYNLIITIEPEWFDCFMDATLECKAKNVMTKAGRIDVFSKHMPKKEKKKSLTQVFLEAQQANPSSPSYTHGITTQELQF